MGLKDFNEEEFEIIADFNHWLLLLPALKKYKRITYDDGKGFTIGYFKLKN